MAPLGQVDHDNIERKLKDVVQELYQIMVQVSTYDAMGRSSRDVLTNEIKNLSQALQALHTAASPPNQLPSVPHELIEYVENGRNPDIYTREFVETVRRGNQLLKGKLHAFGSFRDVLAAEMAVAMPELRQDVDRVCEATGGKPPWSRARARAAPRRRGRLASRRPGRRMRLLPRPPRALLRLRLRLHRRLRREREMGLCGWDLQARLIEQVKRKRGRGRDQNWIGFILYGLRPGKLGIHHSIQEGSSV
ncbi:hypothetical protein V2G26_013553 [Clonostachys chloroleuca]